MSRPRSGGNDAMASVMPKFGSAIVFYPLITRSAYSPNTLLIPLHSAILILPIHTAFYHTVVGTPSKA